MRDYPAIVDNRTPLESDSRRDLFHTNYISLAHVLNRICRENNHSEVRIAVGYFSPNGWRLLGTGLNRLIENKTKINILLGSRYEIERTDEFQVWFQNRLESLPLDIRVQEHILSLIDFLESDLVRLAVLSKPFVHAKLYWFPDIAYVGSSNLTAGGLKNNIELNLRTIDSADPP